MSVIEKISGNVEGAEGFWKKFERFQNDERFQNNFSFEMGTCFFRLFEKVKNRKRQRKAQKYIRVAEEFLMQARNQEGLSGERRGAILEMLGAISIWKSRINEPRATGF